MTNEEKELLLKDLCARLPYHLKCIIDGLDDCILQPEDLCDFINEGVEIKPYLRPMSSMTEEEENEWWEFNNKNTIVETHSYSIDWLNAHNFDYRGLISMGLALEAPEGMYK